MGPVGLHMLDTIKGSWFFVYEIPHIFNNLLFPLDPQRSCVIKKKWGVLQFNLPTLSYYSYEHGGPKGN